MFKLNEGRKQVLLKARNARYNHDKGINKNVKKAILKTINNKEESMHKWIQTIITIVVFIAGVFGLIATSATQYERINNGIQQNSKALSELIDINKSSVKRVAKLERTSDKMEIYVNLNRAEIKALKK